VGDVRKAEPEVVLSTLNTAVEGLSFTEPDVDSLIESPGIVAEYRYTAQHRLSASDLPSVRYEQFHAMRSWRPQIGEEAAWLLLLTALDRPVWPKNDLVERLLDDAVVNIDKEETDRFLDWWITPLNRIVGCVGVKLSTQ
jgi:hypothetical protein